MNIVTVFSPDWLKYVQIEMFALLSNNKVDKVYLLSDGEQDLSEIDKIFKHFKIKYVYVDMTEFAKSLTGIYTKNTFARYTLYRLFIPYIVQESKVLYLDADTVVVGKIDDFYNTEVETMAGCIDTGILPGHKQQIGLPEDKPYLNAGVILLNLDNVRGMADKWVEMANTTSYPLCDQDIWNITMCESSKIVPCKYNSSLSTGFDEDVRICHFTGFKPWHDTRVPNYSVWRKWERLYKETFGETKILIGAPVRQSEGVFREYLKSLDNLEKPDNVTIDRFFYLHNSPELAKLLKPDEYLLVTSDEDYKRDENTHEWKSVNLKIVTYLKNDLLKRTIEGDYDYFMLVDSDLILHPKTLVALFEADKPITAEVFWTKWQAGERPTPNAWDLDHFTFYEDSIDKWKNPGLYKVGGTGACILIHRSVIESGVNYSPLYNVSFWGEDRSFSIRATAHDYELWLDTNCPCKHLYRKTEYQKYVENGGYEAAFSYAKP